MAPIFACICGGAVAILLIELLLSVLPVIAGIHAAAPDGDWPSARLSPNAAFTYSRGWDLRNVTRGRINNLGFVAPHHYLRDHEAILVFGDSFVESLMNAYDDTLQGRLGRLIGDPADVYNFGVSGAGLSDYLGNARTAARLFRPKWAVFVITAEDVIESETPRTGHFHFLKGQGNGSLELSPPRTHSWLERQLRSIATIRYLRGNLKVTTRVMFKHLAPPVDPEGGINIHILSTIHTFLRDVPDALGLPADRVILVFDSDRARIYGRRNPGHLAGWTPLQRETRESFMDAARVRGFSIVDTRPIFAEEFARSGRRLDHGADDMHWNPIAHVLVAHAIHRIMIVPASTD
ncbi:MAG: hypothetical protein ACKVQT_37250 [Burkholderiales bacterium]